MNLVKLQFLSRYCNNIAIVSSCWAWPENVHQHCTNETGMNGEEKIENSSSGARVLHITLNI